MQEQLILLRGTQNKEQQMALASVDRKDIRVDRFDKLLRIVELVIIEQLIRHFEEVGRQIEIVFSI